LHNEIAATSPDGEAPPHGKMKCFVEIQKDNELMFITGRMRCPTPTIWRWRWTMEATKLFRCSHSFGILSSALHHRFGEASGL
jgi:hypothetical protein